ncbi:hypothetical protein SH611_12485 [Geminicoccaceae bacterium 1502E]|nr:hypothetical protein [Geminicoccaceae bacterium 1502E]
MSGTTAPITDPAAAPHASSVTKTNPSPEDQAAYSALVADLTRVHAPEGAVEEHWVGQMAMLRERWADALEQRVVETALTGGACKGLPPAVLLPRWRGRLEKDFCQAVPPASPRRPRPLRRRRHERRPLPHPLRPPRHERSRAA